MKKLKGSASTVYVNLLILEQAESIVLPLAKVYLKHSQNQDAYEKLMKSFYTQCARQGIEGVIFGDIFQEDQRLYREGLLKRVNAYSIIPIMENRYCNIME